MCGVPGGGVFCDRVQSDVLDVPGHELRLHQGEVALLHEVPQLRLDLSDVPHYFAESKKETKYIF